MSAEWKIPFSYTKEFVSAHIMDVFNYFQVMRPDGFQILRLENSLMGGKRIVRFTLSEAGGRHSSRNIHSLALACEKHRLAVTIDPGVIRIRGEVSRDTFSALNRFFADFMPIAYSILEKKWMAGERHRGPAHGLLVA